MPSGTMHRSRGKLIVSLAPPTSMAQNVLATSTLMVDVKASSSPATKEVEALFWFRIDRGAFAAGSLGHQDRRSGENKQIEQTGETEIGGIASGQETTGQRENLLRQQCLVERLWDGRAGVEDLRRQEKVKNLNLGNRLEGLR